MSRYMGRRALQGPRSLTYPEMSGCSAAVVTAAVPASPEACWTEACDNTPANRSRQLRFAGPRCAAWVESRARRRPRPIRPRNGRAKPREISSSQNNIRSAQGLEFGGISRRFGGSWGYRLKKVPAVQMDGCYPWIPPPLPTRTPCPARHTWRESAQQFRLVICGSQQIP